MDSADSNVKVGEWTQKDYGKLRKKGVYSSEREPLPYGTEKPLFDITVNSNKFGLNHFSWDSLLSGKAL